MDLKDKADLGNLIACICTHNNRSTLVSSLKNGIARFIDERYIFRKEGGFEERLEKALKEREEKEYKKQQQMKKETRKVNCTYCKSKDTVLLTTKRNKGVIHRIIDKCENCGNYNGLKAILFDKTNNNK